MRGIVQLDSIKGPNGRERICNCYSTYVDILDSFLVATLCLKVEHSAL